MRLRSSIHPLKGCGSDSPSRRRTPTIRSSAVRSNSMMYRLRKLITSSRPGSRHVMRWVDPMGDGRSVAPRESHGLLEDRRGFVPRNPWVPVSAEGG
jgi:hypothetical protein